MSSLVNQVQLIGRLGADAEIKTTSQGIKMSILRLATNERVKIQNGQWKISTLWHQCVVWGDRNKIVEKYGKKGNQLLIVGSINYRELVYEDGSKRQVTEVKVNNILVLKNRYEENSTPFEADLTLENGIDPVEDQL